VGKAEQEHWASEYGTDKQYLEWVSKQSSCLDGAYQQYMDGRGRNTACHVRRASHSGTAFKPPFSAVPMTHEQHMVQSGIKGEVGVLDFYRGEQHSLETAKEWFDTISEMYLKQWVYQRRHDH